MRLTHPLFRDNIRIRNAAQNAPAMRRGERDREAVRILQNAMIAMEASPMKRSTLSDGTLDGDYGGETVAAVARFQAMYGMIVPGTRSGDGVAGQATWRKLNEVVPLIPVKTSITRTPVVTPRAETEKSVGNNSVKLPKGSDLLKQYESFVSLKGKPCRQNIEHQCAVRMSVALMRSDIGLTLPPSKIDHMHSGKHPRCKLDVPHQARSKRLFDYLKTVWAFQRFKRTGRGSMTGKQIEDAVRGKHGIVFFTKCFNKEKKVKNVGGDHIDYWDGSCVMNDRFDYNAGDEGKPDLNAKSSRWFRNAEDVYFLQIPA